MSMTASPQSTRPSATITASLVNDGAAIRLRYGDEEIVLPALWFRDHTTEPGAIDPVNRQRLYTPRHLPGDLSVTEAVSTGDDHLAVAFSDGHRADLSLETIGRHLGWYADPEAPPAPEPRRDAIPRPFLASWDGIGWDSDESDPKALLDALDQFHRYGWVVLTDLPVAEETVRRVANRLGYIVGNNFGWVFDVRCEKVATDLAYTSIELLAHTDLPYRQPPPGIQLLHCLANDAVGGDSTIADGLAAAEAMAAAVPDLFRAMVEVEVEFRLELGFDSVVNTGHVFEYDRHGRFTGIRLNPKLDTPLPRPGDDIAAWYAGRRWLVDWLADPAHQSTLHLGPGDLLLFDNHRILHGRTAFDPTTGYRHLQGCYIEHDGPATLYRLTKRRLNAKLG